MSSGFMNHSSGLFYTTLFLLFFVKTIRGQNPYFYRSVFAANDSLLDGNVIYAQDRHLSIQKLAEWQKHFPNRVFFD